MAEQKFKGVIVSALTPFTEEGKVDELGLESLLEFFISKGVNGILALATAGQGPLMSIEERKLVAEVILNKCHNRIPVMVHVGALTTRETVILAEHACSMGADAVASLPPLYMRLDMASYEQHYRAISSAVSPIPVFVYNNPWAQGRALTPEELLSLNEKKIINGVIDSSRDLGSIYKLIGHEDQLTVIIADTKLSMPGVLYGCPALATAIGNVIPELFVEMFNAVQEKNIEKAVEVHLKIFKISEHLRTPENGALYEGLAARGVPCGVPRLPVRRPSEKEKEIIHSVVKDYKLE
jgi:dihydrodipicolinate synthase/N-acetylneuraminate lyase